MLNIFKRKPKQEPGNSVDDRLATLSAAVLRRAVISALKTKFPGIQFEEPSNLMEIPFKLNGVKQTIYLTNRLKSYTSGKSEKEITDSIIKDVEESGNLDATMDDYDKAKSLVIPLLRSSQYVAGISVPLVFDDFCGPLKKVYAVNMPESIAMVSEEHLKSYRVSKTQLAKVAQNNIEKLDEGELFGGISSCALMFTKEGKMSGYFNGGDLLSSSLFTPQKLYDRLVKCKLNHKKTHKEPVFESKKFIVIPVRRNCLYFAESYDEDRTSEIESARSMAVKEAKTDQSYASAATPLLLSGGKWSFD